MTPMEHKQGAHVRYRSSQEGTSTQADMETTALGLEVIAVKFGRSTGHGESGVARCGVRSSEREPVRPWASHGLAGSEEASGHLEIRVNNVGKRGRGFWEGSSERWGRRRRTLGGAGHLIRISR